MAESIKEAVPKVLKTLWDLENELRGAAQSGVFMRRDEAGQHLSEARRHLDELLGMFGSSDTNVQSPTPPATASCASTNPISNNQSKE